MKKLSLLFVFFVLVFSFSVIAQSPPFQTSEGTSGIEIRVPQAEFVKQSTEINFHTHIYNMTTGFIITNETASCNLHLYNSTGSHILEEDMGFDSNGIEFKLDINSSMTAQLGFVSYILTCNDSTSGGFVSGRIKVTKDGLDDSVLDSTSGISVSMFILFITALFFVIPFIVGDNDNSISKLILKRCSFVIGVYLLMFNSSIMATIADSSGLLLTSELFRYMWLLGTAGYLLIVFTVLKTLLDVLKMYQFKKENKRMGKGDNDDE